jgi:hypothetical protein
MLGFATGVGFKADIGATPSTRFLSVYEWTT